MLSETLENPSIPTTIVAMRGKPFTIQDFEQLYKSRSVYRHDRMRAKLDPTKSYFIVDDMTTAPVTELDIKQRLFPMVYRNDIKDWIQDDATQPMDLHSKLWEVQIATGGPIGRSGMVSQARVQHEQQQQQQIPYKDDTDVESLLCFRAHHCMADGVSLGMILADFTDEADELQRRIRAAVQHYQRQRRSWWKKLQRFLAYWGLGAIRAILYQGYLYFTTWTSPNPWKILKRLYGSADHDDILEAYGGDGGTRPKPKRTISWCEIATVEQVKHVANALSTKHHKVTVNDVFASCLTAALVKLLEFHRETNITPTNIPKLKHLNLVIPVHLQGGILLPGQELGNKIGALACRVPGEDVVHDCQDRLRQVSANLTACKNTPAAFLSYFAAQIFGRIGRLGGITPWLFSNAHANASAVLTNVRGPDQHVHIQGRRVETTLGFIPLPPGIPVGMVVRSYAGTITLSIVAEPWAVPDADRFLSWVVEEYQALVQATGLETAVDRYEPR